MKKDFLSIILAIVGVILVWLPILAPIILCVIVLISEQIFRFDYLMPAELFPMALAGGLCLLWSSIRAHSRIKMVAWGSGLAVLFLVGGQVLAVVTGLASGTTEPSGWWFWTVMASIIIYNLAICAVGIGGILLLIDLFKNKKSVH